MVEDEFRFGNIPAVMFVNVKGMKEVVRKGAVCLDNTFAGGGCLQGPVALTHQPNCPLCSFSFEIVGDVGCSCEIVKSCVRSGREYKYNPGYCTCIETNESKILFISCNHSPLPRPGCD